MASKPQSRPPASTTADLTEPEALDAVRRRDGPAPEAPDTVPRPGEGAPGSGSPPEDGGASDHPIHDDDIENLGPEDYERLTDEVAKTGIRGD
jgi:hypothetical protein